MERRDDAMRMSAILRGSVLAVGLAAGVFAGPPSEQNPTDKDTFSLDLGTHKRQIQHWKRGQRVRKDLAQYWLVAVPVNGNVRITEMAAAAGFKVLGVHRDLGKVVYKVEFGGGLGGAEAKLQAFDEYFSLDPVFAEDKVSQDLRREAKTRLDRKWARSATQDKDPLLDNVKVQFVLKPTSTVELLVWARKNGIVDARAVSDSLVDGEIPWGRIDAVSTDPLVKEIRPVHRPVRFNDVSRSILGLRSLQFGASTSGFLDTVSAYGSSWNSGALAGGNGVWVGVFDGGVDDAHPDLRISASQDRRVALANATWWQGDLTDPNRVDGIHHATHVAGTILGSGAAGAANGGRSYQWRGVAPLARVFSLEPGSAARGVDVGNHSSYFMGFDGVYTSISGDYDRELADHARRPISVFAAANNGVVPQVGRQVGYFSMMANLKNGIKVGAVDKANQKKVFFSSLGPTRDGRIGPDVMAPGAGGAKTGTVTITEVSMRNSSGRTVNLWDRGFAGNQFEPSGSARSITAVGNIASYSAGRMGLVSQVFTGSSPWRVGTGDQVRITVRNSIGQGGTLTLYFTDGVGVFAQSFPFSAPTADQTSTFQIASSFQNHLVVGSEIYTDFVVDPIRSSGFTENAAGTRTYGYEQMEGTSMAAPLVTGVVALMLERFGRTTGRSIHTDRFWNSTARAILVHTAKDMSNPNAEASQPNNPDFVANAGTGGQSRVLSDIYGAGPDWATGYGLVDAAKAVEISGTSKVREEVVDQFVPKTYRVTIPSGQARFRATLAWDDPAPSTLAAGWQKALVNDLDLVMISPTGAFVRPWVLDPGVINDSTTHPDGVDPKATFKNVQDNPAHPGRDSLNNLEVVDLTNPTPGVWTIMVTPRSLIADQNAARAGTNQDFSLVTDISASLNSTYATLPAGAKGVRFQDPSGGLAELSVDGSLYLKNCSGTAPVTGGMEWNNASGLKASLDRTNGFRSAALDAARFQWLSAPANLAGGVVVYNPDDVPVFRIGSDGNAQVSRARTCNVSL